MPRQEKLINYARQAEQRRRQVKKQLLAKQREDCTFQPNTSATRSYKAKKEAGKGARGGEEPASERLYKLHTLRQAKLKRERKRMEAAAKEAVSGVCMHAALVDVAAGGGGGRGVAVFHLDPCLTVGCL